MFLIGDSRVFRANEQVRFGADLFSPLARTPQLWVQQVRGAFPSVELTALPSVRKKQPERKGGDRNLSKLIAALAFASMSASPVATAEGCPHATKTAIDHTTARDRVYKPEENPLKGAKKTAANETIIVKGEGPVARCCPVGSSREECRVYLSSDATPDQNVECAVSSGGPSKGRRR